MNCQNCQTEVANDLVFCTECGSRLHQTISDAQTVILPESVVTKATEPIKKPKSALKILGIIIGIVVVLVIPISLIIAYFALNNPKAPANKTTVNNSNSTNRKTSNQNKSANTLVNNSANNWNLNSNSESNTENTNANIRLKAEETKILDERVNIDANGHIAFPFKVSGDIKIVGEVEILEGEQYEGFVFLQEVYDEHSVDSTYKMFSFDVNQGKIAKIEQYLPKGNYVLVFANNDGNGASLKAKFAQIKQTENWKK